MRNFKTSRLAQNVRWTARLLPVVLILGTSLACEMGGSDGDSPISPPSLDAVVAVIGCSQTTNAWRGWLEFGDPRVWDLIQGYGGGDIRVWSRQIPGGDYWGRFEQNAARNATPTAVWWQICDLVAQQGSLGDAQAVLDEINKRMPEAQVFVSALADFERPETCVKQDVANSRQLADLIVGTGKALPGPVLPMVQDAWIQQGDGGCHVGDDGRDALGLAASAFPWS